MLTADQLHDMTDEQRWELFERLCATRYGDKNHAVQLAEEFRYSRQTYFAWKKKPSALPYVLIMLLDYMNAPFAQKEARTNTALSELARDFSEIATKLGGLASHLAE